MKKVDVIGVPMKYGCFLDGADMAFESTRDIYEKKFDNIKEIDNHVKDSSEYKEGSKLKYESAVKEITNRLYNEVSKSLSNGNFPLTIGGDHSTAIGSVSASLEHYKGDVSVIWFDAHTDIHTDETTPSGNIHGIPLSVCIGRCRDDKLNISEYKLDLKNLYYIGIRSYEKEEIEYVEKENITKYSDVDVIEKGIEKVVDEISSKVKTKNVHLSFDLDVLNDDEFPAVNVLLHKTYVSGNGLNFDIVNKGLKLLFEKLNIVSMDIVEYNPLLDKDLECKKKIEILVDTVKNSIK